MAKKLILFFKNNFKRINHCKFICHKSHLKPTYLLCIVHKENFSIIFNVKKCALYLIKYGMYHISSSQKLGVWHITYKFFIQSFQLKVKDKVCVSWKNSIAIIKILKKKLLISSVYHNHKSHNLGVSNVALKFFRQCFEL